MSSDSRSDRDLQACKARLLQQRQALREVTAMGDEAARPVELDQTRVGRVSRVDALQSQAMSIEAQRRRNTALQRIEAALRRIDIGDYGYCVSCDEAISAQRLEADPAVPLCIACANKAEQHG